MKNKVDIAVVVSIRNSWPPKRYVEEPELYDVLDNLESYVEHEKSNEEYGDLVFFYSKVRMAAEHYGVEFKIPKSYQEACKDCIELMIASNKGPWHVFFLKVKKLFR